MVDMTIDQSNFDIDQLDSRDTHFDESMNSMFLRDNLDIETVVVMM